MAVNVIDTIKPKNQGTFPVVEAVDVKVTDELRLDAALNAKAEQSDLETLSTAVEGKASQADLETLSTAVSGKQNALTTEQLTATNSGITSQLVTQIGTNTTAIAGKADTSALTSATNGLQAQIDAIISPATQDSEVQNARTDANGETFTTLKGRIDNLQNKTGADITAILTGNDVTRNRDLGLEQGVIQQTGAKATQSYTVRTSNKLTITSSDILIYDNSTYKVNILGYDNASDEEAASQTGYVSVSPISLLAQMQKSYINLDIRRIDEADITPSEIAIAVVIPGSIANTIAYDTDIAAAIQTSKDYFDLKSTEFLKKTVGKNKFNKNAPAVSGKYVSYITGSENTNPDFSYQILPCEANADYAVNRGYIQIAFYSEYPDQFQGYISGAYDTVAFTFHTPNNARYMTFSYANEMADTLQLELGTASTEYAPYATGLNGGEILNNSIGAEKLAFDPGNTVYNEIVVDTNGSGDYTSIREALESIENATSRNQYIVKIKPGTYDIAADYTAEEWAVEADTFKGLFVPDYTTLLGIGNKEDVIITASDSTQREYISTLNLRNTSSLKNLTVRAKNLRYTIHDDMATAQNGYERVIENCDFYGETLQRTYVYGCGIKQNADYKIKNCNFTTDATNNFSFLMHNNTNWTNNSKVSFENCRFMPYDTSYGVLLASMNTGAKLTYVEMKGNKMKRLRLNENNAASYGAGIQFKVKGYANSITDQVEIIHTDEKDYSSYVDLI